VYVRIDTTEEDATAAPPSQHSLDLSFGSQLVLAPGGRWSTARIARIRHDPSALDVPRLSTCRAVFLMITDGLENAYGMHPRRSSGRAAGHQASSSTH
jgi:hypothetical protein